MIEYNNKHDRLLASAYLYMEPDGKIHVAETADPEECKQLYVTLWKTFTGDPIFDDLRTIQGFDPVKEFILLMFEERKNNI